MALDGTHATVHGTFRADVVTGEDARIVLHLAMPDGTTLSVDMTRLPQWVTDEESDDDKRRQRHEREDKLPRSRAELLADILSANRVTDHDSAQADTEYLAWKAKRGPKPSVKLGAMLDAFDCSMDGRKPCCLLEAFERDTKGCTTWRDIVPVLSKLADALRLDSMVLPDDVIERHIAQDAEVML